IWIALDPTHRVVLNTRQQAAADTAVGAIGFYPALDAVVGCFHGPVPSALTRGSKNLQGFGLGTGQMSGAIRDRGLIAITAAKTIETGVLFNDK
ncbi:MAG: hypothetical protein QOF64_1872, partial [Candidatus Binatota bacterium]|nr:hypothetical protein [Candidatus Binatota bacterium]